MAEDSPTLSAATQGNARIGLWLFGIYCFLYAGFVGITAFSFKTMAEPIVGVDLAIIWGIGLIVAALLLAVVYMFLCKPENEQPQGSDEGAKS